MFYIYPFIFLNKTSIYNRFCMKKTYLLLLLSIGLSLPAVPTQAQCEGITAASITNPGPYEVATLTEAAGIRNGPGYAGATIYYPTTGTPPYPSIAIVPGFVSAPSSVEEWGPFYASHGIVAIIIGTNSLFDDPELRATGLLDALETIKQENVREGSPLLGALDLDKLAVSGWSMGGGGAQRAAVRDSTISAVVALCPYLESPMLNHKVPVLIFSGQLDAVAPPATNADLHYSSTPSTTSKVLYEIALGDHSVANTPTGGDGAVGKVALSWLQRYFYGDNCYCLLLKNELLDNPPSASKIEQQFTCDPLGIPYKISNIRYYPNPTTNVVHFDIEKEVRYELISPLGQRLQSGTLSPQQAQIDLSQYPASIYYLYIEGSAIKLIKYD